MKEQIHKMIAIADFFARRLLFSEKTEAGISDITSEYFKVSGSIVGNPYHYFSVKISLDLIDSPLETLYTKYIEAKNEIEKPAIEKENRIKELLENENVQEFKRLYTEKYFGAAPQYGLPTTFILK